MPVPDEVDWADWLDAWLAPFLSALPRRAPRRWTPVYVRGLLPPGERKRVEPMAGRVRPGAVEQLHHFIAASPWTSAALERVLAERADALVGGPDAVPIVARKRAPDVDDTAPVKRGRHSVGVQRRSCGQLGKRANCQVLVSLTLARGEVPVPVALRLFLPDAWVKDAEPCRRAGVPDEVQGRPKWQVASDEIDRVRAAGARFGRVLGDAEYGKVAAFRHALDGRGLALQLRCRCPICHPWRAGEAAMSGVAVEAMLELWASEPRGAKARARLRPLFSRERVATSAGLFLDGPLGPERRKTGWMRAEAAGDPSRSDPPE